MSNWKLNEDSTGVLTLEFKGDVWTEALDKAFEKNKANIKVDGFREGNVPRSVFEKKYGVESLFSDAIDFLLETNYAQALVENNVQPVSYPEISIESVDENGAVINALIAISPELKLGEYKSIEIEVPVTNVTDELVDAEVEKLLEQNAEMVVKEGSVENGDTAVIDYAGYKGDVAFEGGTAQNHPLVIGSGSFIPGFEEQVVGMSVGEEKDINLTFPEEYHSEELAGADVVFKVKVNEIKNRVVPTLSDEFVADLDMEANTIAELKELIKKNMETNIEAQKKNMISEMLLEKVADNSEVAIPKQMIDSEVARMIHDTAGQLSSQGLSIEQYYEMTGTTEEQLKEQLRPDAEKRTKHMLTLEKLIEELAVSVEEKEIDEELKQMAEMYSMEVEAVEQAIGGKGQLEYSIKARKVFDSLAETAKISEVEQGE